MHTGNLDPWIHSHEFAVVDAGNERRTAFVVVLTAVTMVVEVAAGFLTGSMALLADGWHMGTHVAALSISVFAYRYARRHAADRRFTFGTGKVGALGGFGSAVALAVVALLMAAESVERFVVGSAIRFDEAIVVAVLGLAVNVASAFVLSGGRGHAHQHAGHAHRSHEHGGRAGHAHDHNFRAAYLHVIADALTSVLAIIALVAGKFTGHVWPDPLMGLIGGAMIARWSYGLLRQSGGILLDAAAGTGLLEAVRAAIESEGDDRLSDLHVWSVGPNAYAVILSVVTHHPQPPDHYRERLAGIEGLSHVSVEVQCCPEAEQETPGAA
jgi:cation diffusion facilitator family transporter